MKKRKLIILISSIIMLFIVVGTTVTIIYAAYVNSHSAQRVVAPYETESQAFSSNYLTTSNGTRLVYTTDEDINAVAGVRICNYVQTNSENFSQTDITYDLKASLVKFNGVEFSTADANDVGNCEATITTIIANENKTLTLNSEKISNSTDEQTGFYRVLLAGGDSHYVYYTVTFSKEFINKSNLYLKLVADEVTGSKTDIGVYLRPEVRIQSVTTGWNGEFVDDKTNKQPSDYSGFNYAISGIGSGTYKLEWNHTYLDISQLSIRDLSTAIGESSITYATYAGVNRTTDMYYIILEVDSTRIGSYRVQFYKMTGFADNTSWDDLSLYVTLSPYESE